MKTTLINKRNSDEFLMTKYQEGNLESFNLLYSRYSSKLYGYLFKKTKSKEEAAEIFQNTFLKLHRVKNQYDPQKKFSPWFFSIAYSVLVDFYRKMKERTKIEEDRDEIPDHSPQNFFKHELFDILENSGLSQKEKMLIRLKYIEGHDYKSISTEMNLSFSASRKFISRTLEKLKTVFLKY